VPSALDRSPRRARGPAATPFRDERVGPASEFSSGLSAAVTRRAFRRAMLQELGPIFDAASRVMSLQELGSQHGTPRCRGG
jgi:hypothetical protein